MSRWFRHYAGMMRDDKLVRVALRSKQPIERVLWVWGAILESAAEIDDGGRYDFDAEEAAYFLRADVADLEAVLDALAGSGHVAANTVVKWGARQFSSDRSRDRVAAYRERKRAENSRVDDNEPSRNDAVTLQKRHCDAPETETELDTDIPPLPPVGEPVLILVEEPARRTKVTKPGTSDEIDKLVEAWNEVAANCNLRECRAFDTARRRKAKARIAEYGLEEMLECVGRAGLSSFLTGKNDRGYRGGIEYILEPSKLTKLRDGVYDDPGFKPEPPPPKPRTPINPIVQGFAERLSA